MDEANKQPGVSPDVPAIEQQAGGYEQGYQDISPLYTIINA